MNSLILAKQRGSVPAEQLLAGLRLALIAAVGALMLTACGGGSSRDVVTPVPATAPVAQQKVGVVTGRVTSSVDSAPVAAASVRVGDAVATTDANGNFVLHNILETARAVVRINAAGFSEGFVTTIVAEGDTSTIAAQLRPVGASVTASGSSATTVSVPGSVAQVTLPANGIVRPDGTLVTGDYTVAITAVNPAVDVNAMPGGYQASTGGGVALIESWGALNVTLRDAAGLRLNLAPGKTATIKIPVATRNLVIPATIPLFYFSETTGLWLQDGTATLAGTVPNQYYEGTVAHFTVWNADQIMNTIYVDGCVATDVVGESLANVRIISDGIDYSGSTSTLTDAVGKFRVAIKRGARATVAGILQNRITNTVTAGPSNADITLATCLNLSTLTSAISIKLTWGTAPTDVDSHLFAPDGSHVYFGNKGSLLGDPFANLDVDDVTSFGPEVITLRRLMVGSYTYAVRNYSGTANPGMTASPVRVELSRDGTVQAFTPGAGETANTDWWTAFTLTVDSQCNTIVNAANTWGTSEPVAQAVARQYCVRP